MRRGLVYPNLSGCCRRIGQTLLAGATSVFVLLATAGGVHDPSCPHHQPRATPASHASPSAHTSHTASAHDQQQAPGSDGGHDSQCRCLGPCVGGITSPSLPGDRLTTPALAGFGNLAVVRLPAAAVALPRPEHVLPFSTAPPALPSR